MDGLVDSFGRQVNYLRLSVTDRCDLRCTYCMSETMKFLPRKDLLSLEEIYQLSSNFIARGVRKIRISGGEPLVRRGVMGLVRQLSTHLESGDLDEVTLTTNATQLHKYADELKAYGVERINVSLDTLSREKFKALTRRDAVDDVMRGLDAAQAAGLKVKINTVALKGVNEDEIPELMVWAHGRGMDMTLIEVMPLGEIEADRIDQYIPLSVVRETLEARYSLIDTPLKTGGPAHYVKVAETGGVLGFITPLSNNFCAGCNRVRVTCTGQIYGCLGDDKGYDLRGALRGDNPQAELNALLDMTLRTKPKRHNFDISEPGAKPAVARHMSVTGG